MSAGLFHVVSDGDVDALRARLAEGADAFERFRNGATLLHIAASAGRRGRARPEVVRLLLDAGVDPDARQQDGDTAYDLAEQEELAALLRPLTTPAPLSEDELASAAALGRDLELLRREVEPLAVAYHPDPSVRRRAERARATLAAGAARRVVRWQWLSNSFFSCLPHHSERYRFPPPRLLRRAPTGRQLGSGVTQLGIDSE